MEEKARSRMCEFWFWLLVFFNPGPHNRKRFSSFLCFCRFVPVSVSPKVTQRSDDVLHNLRLKTQR